MNATDLRPEPRNDPLDDRLDRALRSLDVGGVITDTDQIRAEASLERILAAPPLPPADGTPVRRAGWGRRLAWLVPATATAGLVGAVAIPAMTGGDSKAFATWTRTPSAVAPQDLEEARRGCQKLLVEDEERAGEMDASIRPDIRAQTAKVVLSERRGEFVFVALVTESGSQRTCLSEPNQPGRIMAAGGSDPTAAAPLSAQLKPGEVEAPGPGYSSYGDQAFRKAVGRVGPGVTALTLHDGATAIEATVADGWFAAWWPLPARDPRTERRSDPEEGLYTVDVTMADGRVIPNAPVLGRPAPRKAPGPREIGRLVRGGGTGSDGSFAHVAGAAGTEVASVTVHADGREASAAVENGRFSAEWPEPAERRGPVPDPTYDLTLRDGTVLKDVKPVS